MLARLATTAAALLLLPTAPAPAHVELTTSSPAGGSGIRGPVDAVAITVVSAVLVGLSP